MKTCISSTALEKLYMHELYTIFQSEKILKNCWGDLNWHITTNSQTFLYHVTGYKEQLKNQGVKLRAL